MADLDNASPPAPAAVIAPKEAPPWKAAKGAPCTAVYMLGGPVFVATAGKILKIDKDGVADVEYLNRKGKPARLEGVSFMERGDGWNRAGYAAPE